MVNDKASTLTIFKDNRNLGPEIQYYKEQPFKQLFFFSQKVGNIELGEFEIDQKCFAK